MDWSVDFCSQLRIVRDLKVIDCSKHYNASKTVLMLDTAPAKDGIWFAIDNAFATPVSKDDETKGYIPTQVIAELFKSAGYDGVMYKSLLSEDGYNLALFNLNDAEVTKATVVRATSLSFKFMEEIDFGED
jgi:hypothetical protein